MPEIKFLNAKLILNLNVYHSYIVGIIMHEQLIYDYADYDWNPKQ